MMKKNIMIATAVLVIAVLTGALVACNFVWISIPDTDMTFDEIVSDKITQEEWQSIVSGAEDVINYRLKSETADLGYDSCILSEFYEGKQRSEDKQKSLESEATKWEKVLYAYEYSDENGNYRITREGDGEWQKKEWFTSFGNSYADMVEAVDTYWTAQGDGEYELSWSEEKQGYICEYEDFYGIVKFKDGKICAFADYVSGKEKATETFIFYDFGEVEDFSLPPVG